MKKLIPNPIMAASSMLVACFMSCVNIDGNNKDYGHIKRDSFPNNPVNGQIYYNNGHSWIYDYAMMRWVMSDNNGNNNYYYPRRGEYQTSDGVVSKDNSHVYSSSTTSESKSSGTKSGMFGKSRTTISA